MAEDKNAPPPNPNLYRLHAYKNVFLGPDGSEVLEDMKRAHGFYGPLYTGEGPVDPLRLAMAEGERNAVLRIMAILETKENEL